MTEARGTDAPEWVACIYANRRSGPYITHVAPDVGTMDHLRRKAAQLLPADAAGNVRPTFVVWYEVCGEEAAADTRAAEVRRLPLVWQRGLIELSNPQWFDLGAMAMGFPSSHTVPPEDGLPYYSAAQL